MIEEMRFHQCRIHIRENQRQRHPKRTTMPNQRNILSGVRGIMCELFDNS